MRKKKATVPTQIRIDADAKREATEISACIRLGFHSRISLVGTILVKMLRSFALFERRIHGEKKSLDGTKLFRSGFLFEVLPSDRVIV